MHFYRRLAATARGMSFVDVIVGTALLLIVFMALFGILRASVLVSSLAKAKTGATGLASQQMEYLRSLTYDSLGTSGGIPAGSVAQATTTSLNGISYTIHTFVEYVDDPADGVGAADATGITTDYKVGKVTVNYSLGGKSYAVSLVSEFAPPSMETSNGGGTLTVLVVNAAGAPLPGATVQITNASTSPTVNVSTISNSNGAASFPGAATSSSYQVLVSETGYSSAQTYARAGANQNPTPGYLTVIKNQTTSSTFAIDRLVAFAFKTLSPAATSTFADEFSTATKVATQNNTAIASGVLTLSPLGGGSYPVSGTAISVATTSNYLVRWGTASATTTVPANTTLAIHIYDNTGTLIPDAVLSGNSTGFAAFPVQLGGIPTTTYPSLAIGATLTGNGSTTPIVDRWELSYLAGPTPLPNVPFTLTGAKTIGSTSGGTPIYKTTVSTTTGSTGTNNLTLEWDSYALTLSGYDYVDECDEPPYALSPGTSQTNSITLAPATSNAMMVAVSDNAGLPLSGVSVTLSKAGYTNTVNSSSCGNSYFGALTSGTYSIQISKAGYTTKTFSSVPISGMTTYDASFD
jgi:hypothetical protein